MNMNGKDWEKICEICLQQKYKDEDFMTVSANTQGDWGIDGYTSTGIIFQCYLPENVQNSKDLVKKLKKKINEDLAKLEKYEDEIEKLMNGKKIKKWILLTKELTNKDINHYCVEKTREYLEKKLKILDNDFKVQAQPFSFIELQFSQLHIKEKKLICNEQITQYDVKLEENISSDYLENLQRKVKYLFTNSNMKKNYIIKYSNGFRIIEELQKINPKDFELYQEIVHNFELNLPEEIELSVFESDKEKFKEIKQKLERKIKESLNDRYESVTLDKLVDYQIALWLLQCPLDFNTLEN